MNRNEKGFSGVAILLLVVIIGACIGTGVYVYHAEQSAKATHKAASQGSSPQPQPSPVPSSDHTPAPIQKQAAQIDASSWLTYNDNLLGLSFKYPSTWHLSAGDYWGSIFNQSGGLCKYVTDWLKNPNACDNNTIRSFSPGLILSPPDAQGSTQTTGSQLQFVGPTSGVGYSCDGCQETDWKITINGQVHAIAAFTVIPGSVPYPAKNAPMYTAVGIDPKLPTGSKSLWKYFDIYLTAPDQQTINTELAILQTITLQ